MSLLCRLGRHRPRGIPRWNDGLYFATCENCGCDLVRTAFQGWQVPKGYRVVWSDRPPAGRPEVGLVPEESAPEAPPGLSQPAAEAESGADSERPRADSPEPAPDRLDPSETPSPSTELPEPASGAPPEPLDEVPPARAPAGPSGRLPIQDVLAQLNAEDAANRAQAAPPVPPPPPPEAPARRRRSTWDFMDDDPLEADTAFGPERARAPAGAFAAGLAPPVGPEVEPVSRKAGGLPERWRKVRSAVHNFWSGPAEPRPVLVTGLALAVAVTVGVALALYSTGSPTPGQPAPSGVRGAGGEGSETGAKYDPFAASSPPVLPGEPETAGRQGFEDGSAGTEIAYVAASLLICREAPVPEARRVRNLLRGREVRVLGYDGPWASLAYRGGQCWAQAQYLSPVPPL
ncbi:MAG TPA: hypothetical protein VF782_08365 [Allosphingosinicella sp.]